MFKSCLKFSGTAEKQSQRQRPEMAEAPLTLLWGRHLSAAYKSATSKRGRHSCQEYFSLWAALSILKSCKRAEPTESHRQARRQSCCGASVGFQTRGAEAQGEPVPSSTPSKPPRVTPATSMPAAPKKRAYKSQPGSRGQPALRAYS